MISPRRTRLIRVPDLHTFRLAIADLQNAAQADAGSPADTLIVVPTRGAAHQLQRTLGGVDAVTRDELYDRLHGRLADPPRRLSPLERDVMAQAAASAATGGVPDLTFHLRPGLVAEMLRFYDALRRQSQLVSRFEELIGEALGDDDLDRGAARMRQQTFVLAETFREYERRVRESNGCDEHTLRERLIADASPDPVRRVIVTVPDWIADTDGLYVADFDLLTRIPGLVALDLVATDRTLQSGFHERLHNWWPGLEEIRGADPRRPDSTGSSPRPVIITPPGAAPDEPWWTFRDREEELVAVARQLKADRRAGDAVPLERTAVVFKRPLPYLYLAAEVLGGSGIPYQVFDALPLAAEPTAAALDLVLEAAGSDFTRDALVALLRSPHFVFSHEGADVTRESASALDRALSEARYLGDFDRLQDLAGDWKIAAAAPALHAVLDAGRALAPLTSPGPASEQVRRLLDFWNARLRPLPPTDPAAPRDHRARAAIAGALETLAAVHAAHDDPAWTIDDLSIAVRRAIEDHTFAPEASGSGLQLLDEQAARYGDFDDVVVVGVVDPEWPERPRRNIFYSPSMLKSLGWPTEKDRRAAADARFLDLLASASRRTTVSTFTLEDDALVSRSLQLDEIPRARLSTVAHASAPDARVFLDEALSLEPIALEALSGDARTWAELRAGRTAIDDPAFHGTVAGPGINPASTVAWSVSALETYMDCPFKFFAQHVLKLDEEPEDEEVMDPRRQGQFVHRVFERFFSAWQDAGHRAVTPGNLDAARSLFTTVVDRALERLPASEAGLERTRLLGSPAAAGLGEAVLRMEAERPIAVVERLLEHPLKGDFTIETAEGPRTVPLRGKADRLDLLEDGTFRLIDYKLGWPPNRGTALQLPIYSLCAEQRLASYRGRRWTLAEAAYLAFKGPKRVVPLFSSPADRTKVMAAAQQRLADTLDGINSGQFPPRPDDVWRCDTCSFASVCRKDYVGDV